jgi:hypothetical protein
LLPAAALILALSFVEPEPMVPSLTADLDGDGAAETAVVTQGRGVVRVEVRSASGKKKASTAAPAPAADVVRVSLAAAPLGSSGSLLEVVASTDASECVSVWRYRDTALTRIPIQDTGGRALPDCGAPGVWSHRWEREDENAPSVWVRERTESVERGTLRQKRVFTFAGFSLNADPQRSTAEINGIPIPAWYESRLYTRSGLDLLYRRFDLAKLQSMPQLQIVADRERGVFELRFRTPAGEIVAPVEAFATVPMSATASIVSRTGGKTVQAKVRLGGDGNVPVEVRVEGINSELDVSFAPAGSWHDRARHVFPSAADEIASQHLTGSWGMPGGGAVRIQIEGAPPYRVSMDKAVFTIELDHAPPATDFALWPEKESGRVWGVVLRGPNALERIPMVCGGGDRAGTACQADGPSETLRRLGARVNVN